MARKREDKDISLSKNNPQTVMPQGALGGRTKGKRQKNVLGPQPGNTSTARTAPRQTQKSSPFTDTLDRSRTPPQYSYRPQVQGSTGDTQGMAIPMQHMVVPPPMQFPSQQPLHPSVDLLAAMDGWDPMRMYNLAHLGASLGPEMGMGPLEGAGRMGQAGGVMSRSLPARPTQADFNGGGHYISGSRGTAERRSLLEVNLNKAITKKLVSAIHYQQVLDCVGQSVQMFDEVNVATALHRLAKLQPPSHGSHPSPIIYADQFQQLVGAVGRLLPQFEAQAVSNTMWAFATLSYYPENNLLDDLANHAVSIISTFRPQATSNTLWAFAKLGYCPCKALLEAGARQMLQDLSKSVPQDISNTLWAFAALRHHPGAELMDRAARQAVVTMQRFKPQELANTLWSFASLGHDPSNQLLDTMAIQMVARIQGFRPQAVSNSLWAYAKLGYNPGILLLDVAAQKAAGMLHQYTSQELANTVWALATLEHNPGAAMLNSAATQIARRMDQFSTQDTSNAIWAMAQLNHHPGKEMLQGVAYYALRHWPQMKAPEAVRILGALAQLCGCPAATWEALLAKLGAMKVSSFQEADLQQIYQMHCLVTASLAASGECLPEGALNVDLLGEAEHAWKRTVQKKTWLSPLHKAVSLTLWRLGIVHHDNQITPDSMFCVDILLEGTNIVVEMQEPCQYAANCHLPLGRTTARHALLEASGLVVCKVPHFEWALCTTHDHQQRYLSSLVSSCAMASAPRFSPAPGPPTSQAQPLPQSQAIPSIGFATGSPLNNGAFSFGASQGLGPSLFSIPGTSPISSRVTSSSGIDMSSLDRAL